jgi:hypothetical protein
MYSLYHVSPTFLWQRATPVIVGWFAGRTWKKTVISMPKKCLNYCENFYSMYTVYKCGRRLHSQTSKAAGWISLVLVVGLPTSLKNSLFVRRKCYNKCTKKEMTKKGIPQKRAWQMTKKGIPRKRAWQK